MSAGYASASCEGELAAALRALDAADSMAALRAACDALRRLARGGSTEAALVLGRVLWALPSSAAEGAGWLAKAARAGDAQALHLLGLAYFRGQGVGRDLEAARCLQAAATERGSTDACVELALLLELARDSAHTGAGERSGTASSRTTPPAHGGAMRDARLATLLPRAATVKGHRHGR